nr:M81 family metallopeptidase [Mesorhizobium sp. L2C066B000]
MCACDSGGRSHGRSRRGYDRRAKGNGTTLGGIVDTLIERADIEILPVSDSMVAPSGAIDHGFYIEQRQFWGEELKKLAPDAIVLDLHGSMSTTEFEDAEGDFLSYIRSAIGGNPVIGVGLYLHANITPQFKGSRHLHCLQEQSP